MKWTLLIQSSFFLCHMNRTYNYYIKRDTPKSFPLPLIQPQASKLYLYNIAPALSPIYYPPQPTPTPPFSSLRRHLNKKPNSTRL